MKKISVVLPCFNEEENVRPLYESLEGILGKLNYNFEYLFIDNCSEDGTVQEIKKLCRRDPKVKLIVNSRNFGHIRSPIHGVMNATGDAAILMATDFQDPPDLLPEFIQKWEEGYKVIKGVKSSSEEKSLFFFVRTAYYKLVNRLAEVELTQNYTGFGMYDACVLKELRGVKDRYPYFRGLISELGFESTEIEFRQPQRKRGFTKNNLYTLYDMGILGIISHSKIPLRLCTVAGFLTGTLFFFISLCYLFLKLLFWKSFSFGLAPLMIGLFFLGGVNLFFLGLLGEYICAIHTQVIAHPIVVEKERVNFEGEKNGFAFSNGSLQENTKELS